VATKKSTPFGRYLKKQKISALDAAEALGVTKSYVNLLISGAMTPGLKLAIEIQHWTKGTVPADSWVKT
jgi:transcriptional regulator with XRE-family HTH domain